jgi:hypothetical protein
VKITEPVLDLASSRRAGGCGSAMKKGTPSGAFLDEDPKERILGRLVACDRLAALHIGAHKALPGCRSFPIHPTTIASFPA